ncbi:hypothetical protein SAO46_01401 [Staphylococcus aureus O46]|nr:hypothetical protein SAO46_01401 [Staphylococcus aureus O46]
MLKKAKLILIATLLLSGCSTTNNESNKETKSVPEEMEASKYVGQGFQPPVMTILTQLSDRIKKPSQNPSQKTNQTNNIPTNELKSPMYHSPIT